MLGLCPLYFLMSYVPDRSELSPGNIEVKVPLLLTTEWRPGGNHRGGESGGKKEENCRIGQ